MLYSLLLVAGKSPHLPPHTKNARPQAERASLTILCIDKDFCDSAVLCVEVGARIFSPLLYQLSYLARALKYNHPQPPLQPPSYTPPSPRSNIATPIARRNCP